MRLKRYITTAQEAQFVKENPNAQRTVAACACGHSDAFETETYFVIVCDACYDEATHLERYF